jgi:nucleoside-diphosphate-sugar epimerase
MRGRVLLTGASGFIGRHAVTLLAEKGYEVHALVGRRPFVAHASVQYSVVDLLDANQVATVVRRLSATHLLHLAWITQPKVYWSSPDNLRWLSASVRLFDEFTSAGGVRAVVAGSSAEYQWSGSVCQEGVTPLAPATLYGSCKRTLHLAITAASVGWGRVFWVFGPGEHESRLVPYVIKSLLRGQIANCSAGDQVRDFLYVADVAAAFVALLGSPISGAVNIASGRGVSVRDLVLSIGRILQKPELIHFGVVPSPNEPESLVADTNRLNREVGWMPQYATTDALERTIDWWRSQSETSAQ